ncbi:MAG TPA: asparaginase [Thermomicrobiales bacterium]|nr:asparaginase [Thermomicrobiales bacterium]
MANPAVLCEITRGSQVESVHYGSIAVVNIAGELVASVGDPDQFLYYRSSAKPFQAIPVVESGAAERFGFTPAELALCCASHHAERHHQEEVLGMLAKLGLDEGALQCGAPLPSDDDELGLVLSGVRPRSPLQCDCSGKHSGMLAACLQLGYPIDTYLEPEHPLQIQIRALVAECCAVQPEDLVLATDGCSLPTFGNTLHAFARSWAELAVPTKHAAALNRLRAAMIAEPQNVSGKDTLVTNLMAMGDGKIVAKSGAEGLICLGFPELGLGVAIRVLDGSFRAHPVLVAAVLEHFKVLPPAAVARIVTDADRTIYNHNRRVVGHRQAAFQLTS